MMKLLLFGTGEYYNRFRIWFEKQSVVALIDNSKAKQGHYIDDLLVIQPEDIFQYEFDAIIILSFYVKAMRDQLIDLGVAEEIIYHFFDLNSLIDITSIKRKVYTYGVESDDGNDKRILLLSHDLTLGGPAIALYNAARILLKKGYQIVYASMLDGPLRKLLIMGGIPVVIDENLMIATMKDTEWVKKFSLIICNTINFHVFLAKRDTEIPVIWWLHDSHFFYDGVRQEVMDKIVLDNMWIWSVGPIPRKAIKAFRSDFEVENLIYGVADPFRGVEKSREVLDEANRSYWFDQTKDKCNIRGVGRESGKICITIIGYIEHRKGQDILLEAIQNLKPDIRCRAKIFFVGQNTSLLAGKIMESARNIPEIVITGPLDREGIDCILAHSDLLVCPSREDPMPTVVAEAMMHNVPCLISDAVGTTEYIRNGIDGMIFQSENVEQLKKLLEQCIKKQIDLVQMGRNARIVFDNYFSIDAFEERFMYLVDKVNFQIVKK